MKNKILLLIVVLGFVSLCATGLLLQTSANGISSKQSPQASAKLGDQITVHASGRGAPYLKLQDGRELPTSYIGEEGLKQVMQHNQALPLTLAAADFDEDGAVDLVAGYASPQGKFLTLHKGNKDYRPADQEGLQGNQESDRPAPFLAEVRILESPAVPDFIKTGDFNGDQHLDLLLVARNKGYFFILPGDGKSGFGEAVRIELPGKVTAVEAGDLNHLDGVADLVFGIHSSTGDQIIIFQDTLGVLRALPRVLAVPDQVNAIAFGQFNNDNLGDLAIAVGKRLMVVKGQKGVGAFNVEERQFLHNLRALTSGDVNGDQKDDIAFLSSQGALHVLSDSQSRSLANRDLAKWESTIIAEKQGEDAWLQTSRISKSKAVNLLVVKPAEHKVGVWEMPSLSTARENSSALKQGLLAELEVDNEPTAILPVKLFSKNGNNLVVLRKSHMAPAILVNQDVNVVASKTITVSAAPATVLPGGTITVTITAVYSNYSLPPGNERLFFVWPSASTSTYHSVVTPAGWTFSPTQGFPRWTTDMPPILDGTFEFQFKVTVNANVSACTSLKFQQGIEGSLREEMAATAASNQLEPAALTADTVIVGPCGSQITLNKTADTATAAPGELITYTVTIKNNGNAPSDLIFTDTIPANTTFQRILPATDCGFASGKITCTLTLGAGQTRIYTITVRVNNDAVDGALIKNCASVVSDDSDGPPLGSLGEGGPPLTSCAETRVDIQADVAIDKKLTNVRDGNQSLPGETAKVGDILKYTITVTNSGPIATEIVRVADLLPDTLELITPTQAPNLYCPTPDKDCRNNCVPYSTGEHDCEVIGNSVIIVYPTIGDDESRVITLFARVKCIPEDKKITNRVIARGLEAPDNGGKLTFDAIASDNGTFVFDPNLNNNEARVTTTIDQEAGFIDCDTSNPKIITTEALCPGETVSRTLTPPQFVSSCDKPLELRTVRSDGRSIEAPFSTGDTTVDRILVNSAGQEVSRCRTIIRVPTKTKLAILDGASPDFGTISLSSKKLSKMIKKGQTLQSSRTFTITNTCTTTISARLVRIVRDSLPCRPSATEAERDDSSFFTIYDKNNRAILPGTATALAPGRNEFRVEFNLRFPQFPASQSAITARDVLPVNQFSTSVFMDGVGDPLTIPVRGTVVINDSIQIVEPTCASRSGNNFFIRIGVLDPTLKADKIVVDFLNAAGQTIQTDNRFDISAQVKARCPGQRYFLEYNVATTEFPDSVSVRVTLSAGAASSTINIPVGSSCQ